MYTRQKSINGKKKKNNITIIYLECLILNKNFDDKCMNNTVPRSF